MNSALNGTQLSLANISIPLSFVPPLNDRLLLRFHFRDRLILISQVLLTICLDFLYSFFNLGDSQRDFLLLLLQLFQGDDLVAQLRKICSLSGAFAAEIDLGFLQQPLLMTQGEARLL